MAGTVLLTVLAALLVATTMPAPSAGAANRPAHGTSHGTSHGASTRPTSTRPTSTRPTSTRTTPTAGSRADTSGASSSGVGGRSEPSSQLPGSSLLGAAQDVLGSVLPPASGQVSGNGPTGLDLDAALSQYTTGDPHVVVAYIEGGINWHLPAAAALVDHVYVNWRELPVPCTGTTVASATMVVGGRTEPCHTVYSTDRADYDVDGSGVIDAAQWAHDPRVHLVDGTSFVNPEDLISAFCGPGYDPPIDPRTGLRCDVSGWNFFRNSPDSATADSAYPHSDAEMENLLAQCPECTIMPIKAGQEALDRTEDLAKAWLFACESGVSVIDSVTADLGYSTFMRQVISYCERKGVAMAEASNDFDSTDHQGGMYWPHVIPGNGAVPDPAGTAWVRSDETSWGTHDVFSIAGHHSTSGSTSALGGLLGLMLSWGRIAARRHLIPAPLDGPQVVQLLREASTPITSTDLSWPGAPGSWSEQYGYGIPNLDTAMHLVAEDRLPPVTEISSPDWYRIEDPTRTRSVTVTGRILPSPGDGTVRWVTQVSLSAQPAPGSWTTIGTGTTTQRYQGVLGRLSLSSVPRSFWEAPFHLSGTKELNSTEQYAITIRVLATAANGQTGESRRSVDVVHDPSWLGCFPMAIGSSGESQPALADLTGRGHEDVIIGTADGLVEAIDPTTCRELPGFPLHTAPVSVAERVPAGVHPGDQPILADVAVGDLEHTGHLDVVATTLEGEVYAWDAQGHLLPGWPKSANSGVGLTVVPRPADPYTRLPADGAVSAPVLVHLAGPPGVLDVVQSGFDGRIHAWDPAGRDVPGWPVTVTLPAGTTPPSGYDIVEDHELAATPTVAYLFGRRAGPDIVIRSQFSETKGSGIQLIGYGFTYAFDAQGHLLPGWPVRLPGLVEYYGSAQQFITEGSDEPVAAAVHGGGVDDVEVSSVFGIPFLLDGAGQVVGAYGPGLAPGLSAAVALGRSLSSLLGALAHPVSAGLLPDVPVTFTTSGAFGEMGGLLRFGQAETGGLSILLAEEEDDSGTAIDEYEVTYPAVGGPPLPGYPSKRQGIDFLGAPLFAPVGPGPGIDLVDGGDANAIVAYDAAGLPVPGFPKWTPGWVVFSPTAGDLAGNGHVDLVAATREGYLMAWSTDAPASANTQWPRWHHDLYDSGNLGVHARPPGALRRVRVVDGGRVVRLEAPGGTWYTGEVAGYLVAATLADGRVVHRIVRPDGPAGSTQRIDLPPGTRRAVVQAVNVHGLLGTPTTVR